MSSSAMAFVQAGGASACVQRATSFRGRVCAAPERAAPTSARRAAPRMLVEDGEVVPAKGSKWKETLFTGGIPGGEAFYRKWVDDGMKDEFDDMPERLQPGKERAERPSKPVPFLKRIDAMEFFEKFKSDKPAEPAESDKSAQPSKGDNSAPSAKAGGKKDANTKPGPVKIKVGGTVVSSDGSTSTMPASSRPTSAVPGDVQAQIVAAAKEAQDRDADPEAPDESLYAPHFPKAIRNLAPELKFVCEGNFAKDRISMAMTPVTAKCSDVYFPKEMQGKAPIIDIFYSGSLTTASISVKLDDVDPLPCVAPPVRGIATANLQKGPGGGLKLTYSIDGEEVSAY